MTKELWRLTLLPLFIIQYSIVNYCLHAVCLYTHDWFIIRSWYHWCLYSIQIFTWNPNNFEGQIDKCFCCFWRSESESMRLSTWKRFQPLLRKPVFPLASAAAWKMLERNLLSSGKCFPEVVFLQMKTSEVFSQSLSPCGVAHNWYTLMHNPVLLYIMLLQRGWRFYFIGEDKNPGNGEGVMFLCCCFSLIFLWCAVVLHKNQCYSMGCIIFHIGFSFLFFSFLLFIYLFLFVVDFVIHWNETAMGLHVFPIPIPPPPPSPPVPSRFSQCTRSERLSHASNLGWWSVSP